MTELYIDGYQVVLPENFSIDFKFENPFITKNGEFSFEIELPLSISSNAKIYKQINRINASHQIKKRKAILIVDAIVMLSGTEIITNISEKSVIIQIVSGNSELNYLIGGDKKMYELDLGKESQINSDLANQSLNSQYPEFNYIITPVKIADRIINQYDPVLTGVTYYPINTNNIVIQPYLMYIIEMIPQALGYELKSNVLRDIKKLKHLYLVNSVQSLSYGDMMPDMSVKDFISEIEQYFNVCFLIDKVSNSVEILHVFNKMNSNNVTVLDSVVDDFEIEIEENSESKEDVSLNYTGVVYDLSSDNYFKYQCIDQDIMKTVNIIRFPNYKLLASHVLHDLNAHYNTKEVFYDESDDEYYLVKKNDLNESKRNLHVVNLFCPSGDADNISHTFKIRPAKIALQKYDLNPVLGGTDWVAYAAMPDVGFQFSASSDFGIIDRIEGDTIKRNSEINIAIFIRSDSLYDAEYASFAGVFNGKTINVYPLSITHYLRPIQLSSEGTSLFFNFWLLLDEYNYVGWEKDLTLKLAGKQGLYDNILCHNLTVDMSKKYTFKLFSSQKINIESVIYIKNRRFVCCDINYSANSNGLSNICSGSFYEIV